MLSLFPKLQSLFNLQLKGLSCQLGWYIVQLGATFIGSIWLIRHLDNSHWGSISLLVSYHGMFSVFSGIWLKDWVIKAIVEGRKIETLLGSVAFIAVLLSVFGFVVCGVSFMLFFPQYSFLKNLMWIQAGNLLTTPFHVVYFYFDAIKKPQLINQVNAYYAICAGICKVICVEIKPFSFSTFLWFQLGCSLGLSMVYYGLIKSEGLGFRKWQIQWSLVLEMSKGAWSVFVSKIIGLAQSKTDVLLLASLLNLSDTGRYSSALRLVEASYFVPVLLFTHQYPRLVEAKRLSEMLFFKKMRQYLQVSVGTSIVFVVMMWVSAPLFERILEVRQLSWLIGGLSLNLLFYMLDMARSSLLFTNNLTHLMIPIQVISCLLGVVFSYLLIPVWGIYGAIMSAWITGIWQCWLSNYIFRETRFIPSLLCSKPYFMA
ncbi:polysaccharide biosynthesis C-terminal domain-containing protein [Cellulophaga sp. BC115SP]|uniref:polysaccharide biosynthesis C-terminal domain-containing protein n=1 Tax=Cellulophaga sp. BC115SP TaxID=2683263 RepID=UPI0014129BB9|nr:polysaccharide biosynthesis C-terminal domain-containing protein [Cellulophaga sp. BC115SP]NBB29416.1 hypothetical protein [Cellulophaga sp. BC115SP]